jgi:acyl carrier protein
MHPTTTEIDEDTVLREIGLDSLDIVELQLYYEEETNEEIPDPEFPIVTVKDLINVICQ